MEDVQHQSPTACPQSQAVLVRELEVNTSVNATATCLIGGLGKTFELACDAGQSDAGR